VQCNQCGKKLMWNVISVERNYCGKKLMGNDISVDVISVECEGEESYQCGIEPTPIKRIRLIEGKMEVRVRQIGFN